jgi:hypothetical protein
MFIINACVCLINILLLLQVLAIASNEKRDAMKLLHVPSGTIFSNWPTERTPIRYPFSLDFSPNGSFLAVGNDRGRVLLYRYVNCLYALRMLIMQDNVNRLQTIHTGTVS